MVQVGRAARKAGAKKGKKKCDGEEAEEEPACTPAPADNCADPGR